MVPPRRAHRPVAVILTLVAAILLAGCGGIQVSESGNGSTTPIAQRSAADLATVRAGSGLPTMTPSPTRVPPTPTATVPVPPTATPLNDADALLATALLTRDELRAAWTPADPVNAHGFCHETKLEDAVPPVARATGSWNNSGGGYLIEWLLRFPAESAPAAMEHARAMLACDSFERTQDDGDVLLWTFSPSSLPVMGDEIVAREVGLRYANPAYAPMTGSIVIVRTGDVVAIVLSMGLEGGGAGAIDQATITSIAQLAVQRMQQVSTPAS